MTALEDIKKALAAAEQFIVNGVELGYIRMPAPQTPDSAHDTLPMIRRAQTALESLQRENEELRKALKFYADAWCFTTNPKRAGLEWKPKETLLDDCGNIASTALASTGGEHHAE